MAMSRAEIELIIKARNQAKQSFDELGRQLDAVTGGATKAATSSTAHERSLTKSAAAGAAAGVVFVQLAERLGAGLVGAFQRAIQSANRLDSGLVGLSSVAKAFRQDVNATQQAAQRLASDGLMSLADASSALKNLLASGFGLPEATTLVERFKDSAAFGRQGALEFGQAVVSATEGIKNGNSILVDNAGVTKNLSVILKEAGFSAEDLSRAATDTNVRMALFNGLLKETNPQLGDAGRYLQTAAGKQAVFTAAIEKTQQQIGKELQPALLQMLSVLQPVARFVGENAGAFVNLGAAAGAVVAPLLAAKAAAALGVVEFAGLARSAGSALTVFKGVRSVADFRAGLALVGEAAGVTARAMGALGTAAAVAAAAFAGWQLGRWVGELTGATGAIQRATESLMGWSSAQQEAGAKQDTINRAIRAGAASTVTYRDAIEYLTRVDAIRLATYDKSEAAQKRRVDAELALGRITQEQANLQLASIANEGRLLEVRRNRVSLSGVLAQAEKQVRAEIAATGLSVPQLTAALAQNEGGFKKWAEAHKLSAETLDFLKEKLTAQEQARTKADAARKKAADEAEAEAKRLQDTLEQLGTPTLERLNQRLDEMVVTFNAAAAQGLPSARAAALALWPELEKLAATMQQLYGSAADVTGVMQAFASAAQLNVDGAQKYRAQLVGLAPALQGATGDTQEMIEAAKTLDAQQRQLTGAFTFFGEKTPQALRDARMAAERNYDLLRASGQATSAQLQRAWQRMVDAQLAESGRVPSFWQKNVAPGVLRAVETIQTAVSGSFAQMLLGAKSFSDGWLDIWQSLKSGTLQIVNQTVSAIMQAFFQGLQGMLRGQSGAWSQAFAGMVRGSGGGSGMGGVFGLGASTAGRAALSGGSGAIPSSMSGGAIMGGKYVGAGSGGVSAGTVSALSGAAAGGVVGGVVGYKTGNTALGMTAGAATGVGAAMAAGAMKGAAFGPWGIVIGAGVGAAAGYIGAAMRKRKERKLDRKADEEIFALQSDLTDQYGSQERIKRMGDMVGVDLAGAWGSRKREGLAQFKATAKAFEEHQKLLPSTMDEYGLSWENLGEQARKSTILDITDQLLAKQQILKTAGVDQTAIVKAQAGQYNELIAAVLRTGDTLPAALQPVLKQLTEMGLLTDENKRKLLGMTDAVTVDFKAMEEAARRYGIDLNSLGTQFQGARIAADAKQIAQDFDALIKQGADAGGVLFGMREEISKVVSESLKFGTEVPENMRPLIEELSRSGLLLDENGEKIADLSKLKFAAPLEEGFDKVVTAIEKLSGVMTDQLPKDAAEARRRLQEALESGEWSPIRIPFEFVPTNTPTGAPPSGDLPGAANGVFATGPTFRVFAEKEPELGGPVSFMTKVLAGAMESVGALGGGPQISLSFNIGGTGDPVTLRDTIRREVVPEIVKAIAGNVGGSRSNLRTALGVS